MQIIDYIFNLIITFAGVLLALWLTNYVTKKQNMRKIKQILTEIENKCESGASIAKFMSNKLKVIIIINDSDKYNLGKMLNLLQVTTMLDNLVNNELIITNMHTSTYMELISEYSMLQTELEGIKQLGFNQSTNDILHRIEGITQNIADICDLEIKNQNMRDNLFAPKIQDKHNYLFNTFYKQ